jgi:hypothetical protein
VNVEMAPVLRLPKPPPLLGRVIIFACGAYALFIGATKLQEAYLYQRYEMSAIGKVTQTVKKSSGGRNHRDYYWAYYEFLDAQSRSFSGKGTVGYSSFQTLKAGDPIDLVYVSQDPSISEPAETHINGQTQTFRSGVLILFGLFLAALALRWQRKPDDPLT